MVDKNDVSAVLDLIRPSLQADGGDVRLVDVDENGVVSVELQGACKGCPMSQMTLANGVERILKERVPGVTKVVPAELYFASNDEFERRRLWRNAGNFADATTR